MATAAFTVRFDEVNQLLVLQDTTDYTQGGLSLANDRGYISASLLYAGGSTAFYNNLSGTTTFDVRPAVSRYNVIEIPLPLDADGNALSGKYTITYTIKNSASSYATVATLATDYIYQSPTETLCIEVDVNCGASMITSTDTTEYGQYVSAITRVNKLYPPPASGLATFSGTLASLTANGIYTETWTAEIASTVSYLFADGSTATKIYTAVKEFTVKCDSDLCKILCCLANMKKTYENMLAKNVTAAALFKEQQLDPVLSNVTYFMLAQNCGDATKAAIYKSEIETLSGCSTDCGCDGNDTPVPVIPIIGDSTITIVDSPDNSIAVTSTTVGDTTTYHVVVSTAIQNIIANSYNTIVATATPSYLTVTPSGTNPKTYTVDFIGTIPPAVNHVERILTFQLTGTASPYIQVTQNALVISTGTKFVNTPVSTFNIDFATDLAQFTYSNFLTGSDVFTVSSNIMYITHFSDGFPPMADSIALVPAYSQTATNGSVIFRFVDRQTGALLTNAELMAFAVGLTTAKVQFKFTLYA